MRKVGNNHRRKRGRARSWTVEELFYRASGRCYYCKRVTVLGGGGDIMATRDHVHPRTRGGKQAGNLVLACALCNSAKGSMSAAEFLAWLTIGEHLER